MRDTEISLTCRMKSRYADTKETSEWEMQVASAPPFYMIVTGISFSSAQDDDARDWNGSEER